MMEIRVTAELLHDNHDGTLSLGIDERPITGEETILLSKLFPDLESAVELLLRKQALLLAIS